jgi:DNA primase
MDAVEDIKGRLSIEDIISRYVELKRSGRNFKGLSPFTSEKTPSFMVSPEKQIWHDFSSGKGGNMFSFVMEMEGVDFKGALEILARQAGVDLTQYQTGNSAQRGKQKERLYKALELAAKFYQVKLRQNREALEYILKKRGFSKDTAVEFRMGYSPESGNSLTQFLLGKGFTQSELSRAGLSTRRAGGLSDMFRGRIMIPLMDGFGRVVGFTARQLRDDPNGPKYINTASTPVYDKSRHVFGLHLAKDAIRRSGYSVVVEGNLDVIASHQAGVRQVVATAGTAMTGMQLKALGRFAPDVRLAFDQDSAGVTATERSIPLGAKAGVTLSIIDIPSGKDPDELIKKDPKLWAAAIEKHRYAPDWLISHYKKQLDLESAVGKREFSDIILRLIKNLSDPVEQDHYVGKLAKLVGASEQAIRTKLRAGEQAGKVYRKKPAGQPTVDADQAERVKTQQHILALMLMQPEQRVFTKPLSADMFTSEEAKKLFKLLVSKPEFDIKKDQSKLPSGTGEFVKILLLLYEELYKGLEDTELHYEAARLQARLLKQYVRIEKDRLAQLFKSADEPETDKLLKRAKELDLLLKNAKT